MITFDNLIDNRFVPAANAETIDVFEPATGKPYAQVAASGAPAIDAAVNAAQRAFPVWSATPAHERSRLLLRLADLVDRDCEPLAQAESRNCGKPITLARSVDIPRSSANLRFFASAILHTSSEAFASDAGATPGAAAALHYTHRRPRGVAGLITPWNLPLYLLTWKLAPALATGNTVVCKPSEVTPATATMLAALVVEAGFPAGVVNIVHGRGDAAGAALVEHPGVPTLSFTGSTAVGRWIGAEGGQRLKRVSLELGGKNPFVVLDDAQLDGPDGAIATCVRAAFTNQGQICLCASRLLVHERVAERVIEGVLAAAQSLTIADPSTDSTRFGALSSSTHLAKVRRAVLDARADGAQVLLGGTDPEPGSLPARCRDGWFYPPTLLRGLAPTSRVEQEEIFGPVLSISTFANDDDAVALANATHYGLAATLFTRDLQRAHAMAHRLDHGLVWINTWMSRDLRTPFGGAKASGIGREGGAEALRFFTEPTSICVRL